MTEKRIETTPSRTAEWTCLARAASSMEADSCYRSDDRLAAVLAPGFVSALLRMAPVRGLYRRVLAPRGLYEYVIARTKYIDAAFQQALQERFDQVLLFGAGFDTRALRFGAVLGDTRVFELDTALTQSAKLQRYREKQLAVPRNVTFIAIDFDKESLPEKLREAGFRPTQRSLFVLEGVLMYLQPQPVEATFRAIGDFAGAGSRIVFDYVRASVLRGENTLYGEEGATRAVGEVNEPWHFGLEPAQAESFLAGHGFRLTDQEDSSALEKRYFAGPDGHVRGRVNGTHCLVTAEKV